MNPLCSKNNYMFAIQIEEQDLKNICVTHEYIVSLARWEAEYRQPSICKRYDDVPSDGCHADAIDVIRASRGFQDQPGAGLNSHTHLLSLVWKS